MLSNVQLWFLPTLARCASLCFVLSMNPQVVFTPSLHNSYGSTAFPAVNDALAVGDWRQAQRQLDIVIHLLNRATEALTGDLLPAAGAL